MVRFGGCFQVALLNSSLGDEGKNVSINNFISLVALFINITKLKIKYSDLTYLFNPYQNFWSKSTGLLKTFSRACDPKNSAKFSNNRPAYYLLISNLQEWNYEWYTH